MDDIKDIKNQDQELTYLIKRWQKISAAIYLISSFIKDTDQIKWDIRNRSILVLSFLHELVGTGSERHVVLDQCLREIEILFSELELAINSGIIAKMNYLILNEEMELYRREVIHYKMKDSLLSPLQKEFMKIEKIEQDHIGQPIGHEKIKVTNQLKKEDPKNNQKGTTDSSRLERRKNIIKFLKEKGTVSIKDISVAMKNCSEKTIQRELAALVAEGVLYKKGDRRWSTYSLKS